MAHSRDERRIIHDIVSSFIEAERTHWLLFKQNNPTMPADIEDAVYYVFSTAFRQGVSVASELSLREIEQEEENEAWAKKRENP